MQALWGRMILIEGSLVGRGGGRGILLLCACVLLLSHFGCFDVLMFDTPLAIG